MNKNKLNLSEKFFPIYRGRTPEGQWITGAYIPKLLGSCLTGVPQIFDGETFHPVQYSTIGRSVNQCDKNTELIFEDDVIKFTLEDEEEGTSTEFMLICWDSHISGFVMYSNESDLPIDLDECISDGEIIGNIHDNPELLALFEKTVELSSGGAVEEAKQIYDVVKAVYPINITVNAGVDVHELVKSKFSVQYDKYFMNFLDWNDVDGVLDYLYGIRATHGADVSEIIKLIESNCGSAA